MPGVHGRGHRGFGRYREFGWTQGRSSWTTDYPRADRKYLLRGGFFICDDFHGTEEWEVFTAGMKRVFRNRPIVEIETPDATFHTNYDLNNRYQAPGATGMSRTGAAFTMTRAG